MRIHVLSAAFLLRFVCAAFTLTAICGWCASSAAQTETPIYSFTGGADGASPNTTLVADSAGNYYGTTFSGGSFAGSSCSFLGCGVVFKLAPNGSGGWTESAIYTFAGATDGAGPAAGLVIDSRGNLFGTTEGGGINGPACPSFSAPGCGLVFELLPNTSGGWTESVIYSFKGGNDGWDAEAPLSVDSAGNMYSTTSLGGPHKQCVGYGCGEVFKLAPNGSGGWNYSVVHFFDNGAGGGRPFAGVLVDGVGNLFVTTIQGGNLSFCQSQGCGTLVQLAPSGTGFRTRVLHAFTGGADGSFPLAQPSLDSAGNIYAPTLAGGHMAGVCRSINGCGVIFKMSPTVGGGYRPGIAYTFTGGSDGYSPASNLVMDSSGNFYGAAAGNPTGVSQDCVGDACGFIYKLTPASGGTWTESAVYDFTGGNDGGAPYYENGVTFDSAGNIFGTAPEYGILNGCGTFANGCGVAYEITP